MDKVSFSEHLVERLKPPGKPTQHIGILSVSCCINYPLKRHIDHPTPIINHVIQSNHKRNLHLNLVFPGGDMSEVDRLKSNIDELVPDIVALRRDLHEHPELAFEEVRTSNIVAQRLQKLGLEVQTGVAKTGVVGLLQGGANRPGAKTIAI